MTSIRAFLILVILAALVLVIFTATFQGYRSGSDETASLLDRLLEEKISLLSGESALTDGTTQSHQLYQVFSPSGALKKASAQAPETPLVIATDTLVNVSYNGSLWRALSQKTSSGETIVVAERVVDRYAISDNIISKALVPILLSMPVLALLIWLIVSFGLRHLKLLESELRDRSPQNMTALAIDSPPDELVPVIASTNSLLHRLRSAFEREQRFAGDAAHELRTPVSALKVDVHNLGFQLPGRLDEIATIDSNINRMGHIIDQLLMLYRTSSDELQAQFEPVNITALTRDTISDIYAEVAKKHQDLALEGVDAWLSGHEFALQAMIKNLIDNAIKYTPDRGTIVVTVAEEQSGYLISVEDSGPGIPDDLKRRVRERFYRINSEASKSIHGCGLGLSIVDHVVALHGGEWHVEDGAGKAGTLIRVHLPFLGKFDE